MFASGAVVRPGESRSVRLNSASRCALPRGFLGETVTASRPSALCATGVPAKRGQQSSSHARPSFTVTASAEPNNASSTCPQNIEQFSKSSDPGRGVAKRIIPCLDVKDGRVVKGVNFVNLRDAGDPVEQAKIYNDEGADELVFLDISATPAGHKTTVDMVRKVGEQLFLPLTVGGGIRTVEDMRETLLAGADKVGINSAAVKDPSLLSRGADMFGSQCIVLAIDAKLRKDEGWWEVYVAGGRTPTGIDAVEWAIKGVELGAGEILLTSMDADGTLAGFDLPLTRAIADAIEVPVIASGGAGNMQHFVDAVTVGGADAALAASLFHDKKLTIGDVKKYMADAGVRVRPASLADYIS
eukprot:tig00000342_g24237.t1